VDKAQRCVFVSDADREHVPIRYDYLILATGARHSYFGHNELKVCSGFEKPGRCRRHSKQNPQRLEQAEAEEDVDIHRDLLTSFWLAPDQPASRWRRRSLFSFGRHYVPNFAGSIRLQHELF